MKGRQWTASIAVVGWALAAGSASAGELFSPRLSATDTQTLSCSAVNVGKKMVQLNTQLFATGEYDGTPGSPGLSFPPGGSTSHAQAGPISAFCRVTHSGNKKNLRAAIQVSEGGSVVAIMQIQ